MDFWIVLGGGLLTGGIALAWWRLRSLKQTIEQWTRRQYYDQSDLRETARQHADALTILRLQLAQVASGKILDDRLVETGRLYHQISAEEARQMAASRSSATTLELVVVDIRSHKEFMTSHIPEAKHIPFEQLETRGRYEIPKDVEKILVYCEHGEQSRLACDFLSRQGYMNLVTIHDGFQNWTGPVLGTGNLDLIQIQSK